MGTINGNPNVPITVTTDALQNTATFRWGDKDAPKGSAQVKVEVRAEHDTLEPITISDQVSTTLFGIGTPGITGSSSVQQCCTNELTFCATG
ncbi:hypothetical protein RZS08_36545, partial [Arthrospira platensis SPKY1]|nr:hypothetical protein [Arthrospira platensis SPKY1]